jgi:hypothetical protein
MPDSADALVGQTALIAKFGLPRPAPAVTSMVGPGARRTAIDDGKIVEKYSLPYAPEDTLAGHLRFALRYEPLDIGVIVALFEAVGGADIEDWVRREPTGAYSRRAWFLYEWLTGRQLDLPDATAGAYVGALNPDLNITARGVPSKRHRVMDNLLGVPGFCPFVRHTQRLAGFQAEAINDQAKALVAGCDPGVLARAVDYLYTKETKSSFAIERETATGQRAERFVAALRAARAFDPANAGSLIALQNTIVDPRYAAHGLRDFQNFVGETLAEHREVVHFICPRPQDIGRLMADWGGMVRRLQGATDPVVAAALVAFGFVFLHPFEDGNGRIHRFLIHHVLSTEGFTPPDILFPVSAAIVRDRRAYDDALETFSKSIQPLIQWRWTPTREVDVTNQTADLYRYFDATPLAEFLYAKVSETVSKDLREELDFVAVYDAALAAVQDRVDMPDRRASLLVRCFLQNDGLLSRKRRADFSELTDAEVLSIQEAIQAILHGTKEDLDEPWQP